MGAMSDMTVDQVIQRFADVLDSQDWDGLATLLAQEFTARHTHTGRCFDRRQFVDFNRDYPGSWRFQWEDVISAVDRGAGRAKVFDGRETYYVACFLTVADSRIVELVEVWTDVVADQPGEV